MKAGLFVWGASIGLLACSVAVAEPRVESSSYGARLTSLPLPVALESLPGVTREAITKVMKSPTITAVAPSEEFVSHSDMYQWLLDHPDRTSQAWRKLGVGAAEIKTLKDGRFIWRDENGSEMVWQSVARGPGGRIWYAEGKIKPAALSPSFPVTAVAVLNHSEKQRPDGDVTIKHQVEVFLTTDNKAASLVAKVLGDSAPKMAQQGAEQVQMFFSGIAKYTHDKPEKAESLFAEKK
ncbi:hypothetical protein [Zavarzinella formosa]|uniref:hypothetical protein n=1 Tax=Zavarzinella formosa TaxID=360055 RepID=UPI00035DAFF1|nr:hypothetical protein [Zavarzinella formosa]